MKTTWTMIEKTKGELHVEIDGEKWETAQKKALNKLAKNVQVPGFRKGQGSGRHGSQTSHRTKHLD